jgi:hypothetical protein
MQKFLVGYDYGMGGLWAMVDADTKEEITRKYPELTVVLERPKWMSAEHYEDLLAKRHYFIKDAPEGVLAVVVSDRQKRHS